jgi:hypothetical protein
MGYFREVVFVYRENGLPEAKIFGSKHVGGILKNKRMVMLKFAVNLIIFCTVGCY